jgi:cation diffusion facilitator family transporter
MEWQFMGSCCEDKSCTLDALRESQGRILRSVLWINVAIFLGEFSAGLLAQSTALLADSLDALGDALVYAFSLYVLFRSARWRAGAALLKGLIMLGFGLAVGWEVFHKLLHPAVPTATTMGLVGFLVLLANATCLYLLTRHRHDDLNMESVWLCSRNDIIANLGVLVASAAVAATGSMWPDLLVGAVVATLFLKSAVHVLVKSCRELALSAP